MEPLFKGSIIFIYVFFCIAMLSYDIFSSFQKISLIYLTNIGMTYTEIIGAKYSLVLLIIMSYLYEEFLQTYDRDKNILITNWMYKICDFCYLSVFKNYILWMVLALFMVSNTLKVFFKEYNWLCYLLSFISFLICIHKLHAQKYKLETITQMFKYFNCNAYRKIDLDDNHTIKIFNLVVEIEDKSYFIRKNTYSWLSFEFLLYRVKRVITKRNINKPKIKRSFCLLYFKHPVLLMKKIKKTCCLKVKNTIERVKNVNKKIGYAIRGYSTIEMQYIRTIGILTDKRKYVIRRKIYELLYTKIFFNSIKKYYFRNSYEKYKYFKEYLLYQYLQVTYTKINGVPFKKLVDAFKKKNICKSDINSAAVAILGMNGNGIYNERLELYSDIFNRFDIDPDKVLELAKKIQNRQITKLP